MCVCACVHIHACMCVCIYMHMHVCIYVCIFIYTYIHIYIGSTNSDDGYVHAGVRQVVTAEPGEDFARRMAQGFFEGRAVDEVTLCMMM